MRLVKTPQNKEPAIEGAWINGSSSRFSPKPEGQLAGQGAVVPNGWGVLLFSPTISKRIFLTVTVDRRVEVF